MRLIHALYRSQPGGDRYRAEFASGIAVTMPGQVVRNMPKQAARLALQLSRGDCLGAVTVKRPR